MSSRLHSPLRFFGVLAVLIPSSMAYAQFGRPGFVAPPRVEAEPFSGKGKILVVMPTPKGEVVMVMTNEKGETWALRFSKSSKLRVKGKGTAEVLSPGMVIRFDAMYDKKKGAVKDEVKKLLVCGEFPEYTLGTYQDPSAPAGGGELESEFKNTQITGKLLTAKGNKLTVVLPGGKVKFDLAEGAQIDFDLNFNPRWDYTGDEIQASGQKMPMPQMGPGGMGPRPGPGGPGGYGMAHPRGRGRGPAAGQGAAGGPAGGAAPAGGEAGKPAAGGFGGATPAMPSGLVNVTEATITKGSAPAASKGDEPAVGKPRRGKRSAEKAEKPEKPKKKDNQ